MKTKQKSINEFENVTNKTKTLMICKTRTEERNRLKQTKQRERNTLKQTKREKYAETNKAKREKYAETNKERDIR